LNYDSVIENFHFIHRPRGRVCFASQSSGGIAFPDGNKIIELLKTIGAALLIVDPFNHAHDLEDGNSNALMARVASEITRIAQASGAVILVLHHLRKGATGEADDFMGATSLRATFRSVRVLVRMSAKEAEDLGLPPRQAWRYSRIAGTKENYAPPPELATWFKLESVALNNGDELYPEGDNLQVITVWEPPTAFAGLSRDEIADIFAAIRAGPPDAPREFYSPDIRAKRWVGKIVMTKTGKPKGEAERVIRGWLHTQTLIKDKYYSHERREETVRVTLNENKAAEILGPLYTQPEPDAQ
jgi:hypothetical protein